MRQKICLGLIILFLLGTAGCADLSSYDLSGQVELRPKSDGLPYLEVHEYKPRPKKGADSILESISEEFTQAIKKMLSSYIVYPLELYPKLNFTKEVLLCEEPYEIQVDFANLPPKDFNYLKVYDPQGEEVKIKAIEEKIRVGRDSVNMKSQNEHGTKHSGYGLASFLEPYSNNEYILEIDYLIECVPVVVRVIKNDRGVATGYEVEDERIEMYITAKIGNRTYLYGERKLNGKKTLPVSVVDWNLDGEFTDEDMVKIEDKKEEMFFPVNKRFKVGTGKEATWYIIELEKTGDDKYILNINEA
ncbi:MAG: hypothetical protein GX894_09265 [Clostridia bacterium]|nr:hypothetical protein [Clostridia bacterium]